MAADDPTRLPIDEVRPTQLYLSAAKLHSVLVEFDFEDPDYGPLPVFERDGEWHLSDGHTRAFVAHLAGETDLPVERDTAVREEYDFGVYLTCIEWCEEEGIDTVADLAGRVVDHDTFEEEWIERCQRISGGSEYSIRE